ncbi:MAG: FkbM family methyltransferase [Geminicoccaceae bacterium]|nr:FkbM family methyltransferase [Geminicoccaceae bacterium]
MNWLQWVAGVGGFDLAARRKPRDPLAQLAAILKFHAIDLVIDVGANVGQYGSMLRRFGYPGRILSFEPLPMAHAQLSRAASGDDRWDVAPPMALGDEGGMIVIEHSSESDMSSILPQSRLLADISPSSMVLERLDVVVNRLDSIDLPAFSRGHLKIDVQGFEPQVLDGARGVIDRMKSVQLEMALVPVYEGEQAWRSAIARMESLGFELHMIIPGYFERKLARQLQVDGVFVRP